MELIIDGKPAPALESNPATVLDALAVITRRLRSEGRAIMAVSADGRDVPYDQVREALRDVRVDQLATLELRTEAIRDLIDQTLAEAAEVIPELPAVCRELGEVFHTAGSTDGADEFKRLVQIWDAVHEHQDLVIGALDLDPASLTLGGEPLEKRLDRVRAVVKQTAEALGRGDRVKVSDLLQYELAPLAEDEERVIAILQQRVAELGL
jgi:hypothetical protein